MEKCYDFTLQSPMGQRRGTLLLHIAGGQAEGTLSLLGYDNALAGRETAPHLYHFSHQLKTAVGTLSCDSDVELAPCFVRGETRTEQGVMCWSGAARAGQSAGEELKSR